MLRRTSEHLRDAVCEALLNEVRSGNLRPGDRLPPERGLALQFGVSRTVVREALKTLAARGLVESKVGRGTFICKPDLEQSGMTWALLLLSLGTADHVREASTHIAATACAMAAATATPESVDRLAHLFEQFKRGEGTLVDICRCLAECAGNPALLGLMAPFISFWTHTEGPWKEGRPLLWQRALLAIQRNNPLEAYLAFFPKGGLLTQIGEMGIAAKPENLS
jgi:DNA-binding FadR family transcriptional regulator